MDDSSSRIYGNNRFFFGGRLISGPDVHYGILSMMMILVPSILWHVQVGSFLSARYTAVLVLFAVALQTGSITFLLATAFSDPGIIPRQKSYLTQYDPLSKQFRQRQPPRYFDVLVRGHPFKLKYCVTCNIYRPPRCTHCSVCENCIERFDHHCPWIGNCVGKRNYWLFYTFVTTTGMLNTYTLGTAVAQIAIHSTEHTAGGMDGGPALLAACGQAPIAAALVVYATGIVWFTVGLVLYHNYLICTNQTTYEQIKGTYSTYGYASNPFHRGILGNYRDVLFNGVRRRYFNPATSHTNWPGPAVSLQAREAREVPLSALSDSGDGGADEAKLPKVLVSPPLAPAPPPPPPAVAAEPSEEGARNVDEVVLGADQEN